MHRIQFLLLNSQLKTKNSLNSVILLVTAVVKKVTLLFYKNLKNECYLFLGHLKNQCP